MPVAQPDRASASEAEGREFESPLAQFLSFDKKNHVCFLLLNIIYKESIEMKILPVKTYTPVSTNSDITNSKLRDTNTSNYISFGVIKPKTAKSAVTSMFKKIPRFSFTKFINSLKEKREISKFKSFLKYDKDFPKNKIESILANANLEDIKAKEAFYLTTKYSDFLPLGISKEITIDIMSKVNKQNVKLAHNLYTDPYFPKEKITAIIKDTDPVSFGFKENLYNGLKKRCEFLQEHDLMKEHKYDLAFFMEQTDKEYLGFVEKLWNDPAFTKSQVLTLVHNKKEEVDALRQIYTLACKKQYDWGTFKPSFHDNGDVLIPSNLSRDSVDRTNIIRNLLFYTTKNNVKTATELCNLKKLSPEIVVTALKNSL